VNAVYHYTARSESGTCVSGSMSAASRYDAVSRLRLRRLFVTTLNDENSARGRAAALISWFSASRSERRAFMRTMATLIASGMSLQRALDVAIEQCGDHRLRESLCAVASDVEAGVTLSEAMARRPLDFSEIAVAMIRAGELGGVLDEVLERSAELLERRDALGRQVAAALAYPAFVLASAAFILGFVLIVTVPGFAAILRELHAALPLPTRILLWLSDVLRSFWALVIAGVGAAAISGLVAALGLEPVRAYADRVLLRLPGLGRIRREGNVAAFARACGTLIRSGVPLLDALGATKNVLRGNTFRDAVATVESMLEQGKPLSAGLASTGIFGSLCVKVTAVGEESGDLDSALLRLADHVERGVEASIRSMNAMIEPILILTLGAIVGGVVAAVLIPLYAAIGSVR
jgi:type IV pilus assembly protein PilC